MHFKSATIKINVCVCACLSPSPERLLDNSDSAIAISDVDGIIILKRYEAMVEEDDTLSLSLY